MKIRQAMLPLVLVAAGAYGQNADNSTSDVLGPGEVAVVNGERIPESLFRLFALNVTQTNPDLLDEEDRTRVIERLIYLRLFADEAERLGLDRERRIAAELELQRLQVLAQYMTERYTQENPPTTVQIRELYDANLDQLSATRYKTRHILVGSQAAATALIDKLDDGEDFEMLARENSTDPTASSGGELGWISAASVPEPFAAALEASTPGMHFPTPIQTEFGWHVILVEETEDGSPPALEEIRDDLISALETQNLANRAQELREAAEVEVIQ